MMTCGHWDQHSTLFLFLLRLTEQTVTNVANAPSPMTCLDLRFIFTRETRSVQDHWIGAHENVELTLWTPTIYAHTKKCTWIFRCDWQAPAKADLLKFQVYCHYVFWLEIIWYIQVILWLDLRVFHVMLWTRFGIQVVFSLMRSCKFFCQTRSRFQVQPRSVPCRTRCTGPGTFA